MSEGDVPNFKVPTTSTDIPSDSSVWQEYFGDEEEWQYFITDIRQRHAAVLMQDGEAFWWLQRMRSGTKCPFWDDRAANCRRPLDPQASCFNTSFVGGYGTPLDIKIALPSASRRTIGQEAGMLKLQDMRLWTLWTPRLVDRDMVVKRSTGQRYEVVDVEESGTWRGNIIVQFFNVRELQAGVDYGYNVTVSGA